jgi:hypothetical protein
VIPHLFSNGIREANEPCTASTTLFGHPPSSC